MTIWRVMNTNMQLIPRPARLATILILAAVVAAGVLEPMSIASGSSVGIVPPNVPTRNFQPLYDQVPGFGYQTCGTIPENLLPTGEMTPCVNAMLASFAQARSAEGLGPLVLPSNWSQLTPDEQQFTIIDLERLARGLPAYSGESSLLDSVAQSALFTDGDPRFPTALELTSWFGPGAANADGAAGSTGDIDPFGSIFGYMSYDGCGVGPGGGPPGNNTDCSPATQWNQFPSWGHRAGV
ncbi:MAG TPA: hypothetical protein VMU77_01695, partial [Acidimicrobiales bacterium]|nr:hypothetical protein [Acidimicrobiales bacterium]